jgi:hypothetical protein
LSSSGYENVDCNYDPDHDFSVHVTALQIQHSEQSIEPAG